MGLESIILFQCSLAFVIASIGLSIGFFDHIWLSSSFSCFHKVIPILHFPTAPTVTWERDGSPIDINGKGNINTERNGQWLRVVRAGSHNTGVYTCTSSNLVGLLDVDLVLNVLGKCVCV